MKAFIAAVCLVATLALGKTTTSYPHYEASPEQYARLLHAAAHNHQSATEREHVRDLARYWKRVNVHSTLRDNATGLAMDCVPFIEQPALIDATSEQVAEALEKETYYRKLVNNVRLTDEGTVFGKAKIDCPIGFIGVPRHVLRRKIDKDGHERFTVRLPTPKRAPPSEQEEGLPRYNDNGYHYVISPTRSAPINNGANYTFTILGVGSELNISNPTVPSDESHSLNQLWWTTTHGGSQSTVSLETGWIDANTWTVSSQVSIFVYSTPDGYKGGKYDRYNLAGGFVMYSAAPSTLGIPRNNVRALFNYQIITSGSGGYELFLKGFSTAFKWKDFVPIGYYPTYRYSSTPAFAYLLTGQEIYRASPTDTVSASGRIYGWGSALGVNTINNNFSPDKGSGYKVSYGTQSWLSSGWHSDYYAAFSGDGGV